MKTWAQSFLAGVEKVIFGYRDPKGFIQKIDNFNTRDLPRLARKDNLWDPHVCLTFCELVFKFLVDNVVKDDFETVYTIKYSSQSKSITLSSPQIGGEAVFVFVDMLNQNQADI